MSVSLRIALGQVGHAIQDEESTIVQSVYNLDQLVIRSLAKEYLLVAVLQDPLI